MAQLYLLRHGEAAQGYPDSARELTIEGIREVKNCLQKAAFKNIPRDILICHSELVRARQTAKLAHEHLGCRQIPIQIAGIDPMGDPAHFIRSFAFQNRRAVMLVTHNPFVEDLTAFLTDQRAVRIRTGSMLKLELDHYARGCARLEWQQG